MQSLFKDKKIQYYLQIDKRYIDKIYYFKIDRYVQQITF